MSEGIPSAVLALKQVVEDFVHDGDLARFHLDQKAGNPTYKVKGKLKVERRDGKEQTGPELAQDYTTVLESLLNAVLSGSINREKGQAVASVVGEAHANQRAWLDERAEEVRLEQSGVKVEKPTVERRSIEF